MNFVYPNFLWALFLLLIPIIIHIFSFRRYKTIYFSRVESLKEIKEDSRTGARLKHLLILASRLLFLAALVLAFAQPFIPQGENRTLENISTFYIDNSFSMEAEGIDGNLLNESKNKALEVLERIEENEKICILTSDLNGDDQRFLSKKEAQDRINEIDFSAQSTPLGNVINVSQDLFARSEYPGNRRLLIFSDFQKSTTQLAEVDSNDLAIYYYKSLASDPGNIYIDSVWFESPVHRVSQENELYFRIRNETNQALENLSVTLYINNDSPRPKTVEVPAGSYVNESIKYSDNTPGEKKGTLSISTNQLFFDDSFFFTYSINENVPILLLTGSDSPRNLEQLYGLSDYYNATTRSIQSVTPNDFENKSCIILQNVNEITSGIKSQLITALENGATISLIPGTNASLSSWNSLLSEFNLPNLLPAASNSSDIAYFNADDPIYFGNFEEKPENFKSPQLYKNYRFNINSNQEFKTLFGVSERTPFLVYTNYKNGRIFIQNSPISPEFSNFQNHALFGLTYLRIVETSIIDNQRYMTIGDLDNMPINFEFDETNPLHLINSELEIDVIPQMLTSSKGRFVSFAPINNVIKQAGFYSLEDNVNFKKSMAFNFNRFESEIEVLNDQDISALFISNGYKNVQTLNSENGNEIQFNTLDAKEYWRILLILALLFLAIEILLLKFWKT